MCGTRRLTIVADCMGPALLLEDKRGARCLPKVVLEAIRIGLVSDEPIRLEGLASILDQSSLPGKPQLLPMPGSIEELLAAPTLEYLRLDLHSSPSGIEVLDLIRRARPSISA